MAVSSFFRGAIAPDMGYFPGGERALSDLIHRSGAFELSRALHGLAATDRDRAFALGWRAHILGDAALHPEVNRESGKASSDPEGGSRSPELDPGTHLRVELGLDAHLIGRLRETAWDPVRIASTGAPVGLLANAFQCTYGRSTIEAGTIARSDNAVSRLLIILIQYLDLAAAGNRISRRWPRRVDRPADRSSPQRRRSSLRLPWPAEAFSSPIHPSPRLLRATLRFVRDLPAMLDRDHLQVSLSHPDLDLDTGVLNHPCPHRLILPGISADERPAAIWSMPGAR